VNGHKLATVSLEQLRQEVLEGFSLRLQRAQLFLKPGLSISPLLESLVLLGADDYRHRSVLAFHDDGPFVQSGLINGDRVGGSCLADGDCFAH
jgi:hypothetical protein